MIRTAVTVFLLIVAVLTVPLWAQLVVFCIALVTVPYRVALFIPALFADILYAPTKTLGLHSLIMTAFVAIITLVYWLVMTQTRIAQVYGLETK